MMKSANKIIKIYNQSFIKITEYCKLTNLFACQFAIKQLNVSYWVFNRNARSHHSGLYRNAPKCSYSTQFFPKKLPAHYSGEVVDLLAGFFMNYG